MCKWLRDEKSTSNDPVREPNVAIDKYLAPFANVSADPAWHFAHLLSQLFGFNAWPKSEKALESIDFARQQSSGHNLTLSFVLPVYFLVPMMSLPASTGKFQKDRGNPTDDKPMRTYFLRMSAIERHAYNACAKLAHTGVDK